MTVMRRRYTGWDGNVSRALPSMNRFIDHCVFLTEGGLWNNGSWGVRPKRGHNEDSVHGTGRAVDLSFRKTLTGRGRRGYGDWWKAVTFVQWLVDNADTLQIELVIDYAPKPYGRAWRCDRGEWLNYSKRQVAGGGSGDWFHIEISPDVANDPLFYDRAFKKALGV